MATLSDILAATKVIAEAETLVSGSGYKPELDRAKYFEGEVEDNDGSATSIVRKRVVEVESVVMEPSLDGERELYSGLVNQQADEISVQSNGGMKPSLNGIGVEMIVNGYAVGEKIENGGGSYALKGDATGTNVEQLDVGADGKQEGSIERLEDQSHEFRVGDFVWGKIKSRPWRPGQIYDIKDASEFAVKFSQQGRLLVAFFGDGSSSWCLPSQLVPFVQKFEDMCMDSRSKSILNATQSAVNEIGRIVESEMACSCIPEEKRGGLARPAVENAGVKAGVLRPEVDSGRFSIPEFKPVELLSKLRDFAIVGCANNALELAVWRSWLSAFYRFNCGGQLPAYRDPVPIEGLEDQNQSVTEIAPDSSVPIEVPIGPADDDWVSSPTKATSDDRLNPKRKHKSIAELISENTSIKPKSDKRARVNEGTDLAKETSSRKKKKIDCSSSSGKMSSKRKINVSDSSEILDINVVNGQTNDLGCITGVNEEGSLKEKPKELEVSIPENTPVEEKEALGTLSSPRERKKSKYLSPPFTNITWRMGNSCFKDSKGESDKIEKTRLGVDKIKAKVENHSKWHLERSDTSVSMSLQSVENDKTQSFSISDVDAPQVDYLSKIQRAAIDPLYLSCDGSFDTIIAFSSALRSATYSWESDYEVFRQCKGTKKRKLSSLQHKTPGNDQKSPKVVKVEGVSKPQKKAKTSDVKVAVKILPCLVMIFKRGSHLPSKEDIVKHFGKFGSLNERDTSVMPDSHLIQIVFMKESEATKAFKSSMNQNYFGFENLLYDMVQLSPGSSSGGSCPKVPWAVMQSCDRSDSLVELATDVRVITNKLMIMTAILQNYQSKFSEEDKAVLKGEMKCVMEKVESVSDKVETVSEKVRTVAEEASS